MIEDEIKILRGMLLRQTNWHYSPSEEHAMMLLEAKGYVYTWATMGGFPAASITKKGIGAINRFNQV